jgi:two-component system alkaline phosphatase synthesis response regulator PhoP
MMGKTVMVIDDDANTVRFLFVLLEENGYRPLTALDGREGMQKLQENDVDLIVLDVMMPKKTGFVLFKQLKKDARLKDVPVLMLTGVAASLEELDSQQDDPDVRPHDSLRESLRKMIREMRESGELRPEMFVDKPLDPDSFIARVRDLIGE